MEFLKKFLAVAIFNLVAIAYTGQTNAFNNRREGPDARLYFQVRQLLPHVYDFQQYYNDDLQTLRVQYGLRLVDGDSEVKDLFFSAVKAPLGSLVFLDVPEYLEGCNQITQQQFEYAPGLDTYLLMFTIKGPECRTKNLLHPHMNLRVRFDAVPVSNSTLIPVALEVQSSQR